MMYTKRLITRKGKLAAVTMTKPVPVVMPAPRLWWIEQDGDDEATTWTHSPPSRSAPTKDLQP